MLHRPLKQLTLDLAIKTYATYANFIGGDNLHLLKTLQALPQGTESSFIYLYGASGSGKTHLTHALAQDFAQQGISSVSLPLEDKAQFRPEILADLEQCALVIIDDLELIAGDTAWEEQVFCCFNEMITRKKKVVVTAKVAPHLLPLQVVDLKSRMVGGGLVFNLKPLDDGNKSLALRLRAQYQGLQLDEATANFLVQRCTRDLKSLFQLLDQLDQASLAAKRRITIPFIKEILFSSN